MGDQTIVEAYVEQKGQLVIFVSGLPGSGKSTIGKNIARDFGIEHRDLIEYERPGFEEKTTLPNGREVINKYTDDAFDWLKLNGEIEANRTKGIVVTGMLFPTSLMSVEPDLHTHITLAKRVCLDRLIESQKKKGDDVDDSFETLKMNRIIFPYYLQSKERMKIHRFVNGNSATGDELYRQVAQQIVDRLEDYLYRDRPEDKSRNHLGTVTSALSNSTVSSVSNSSDSAPSNTSDSAPSSSDDDSSSSKSANSTSSTEVSVPPKIENEQSETSESLLGGIALTESVGSSILSAETASVGSSIVSASTVSVGSSVLSAETVSVGSSLLSPSPVSVGSSILSDTMEPATASVGSSLLSAAVEEADFDHADTESIGSSILSGGDADTVSLDSRDFREDESEDSGMETETVSESPPKPGLIADHHHLFPGGPQFVYQEFNMPQFKRR